MSSNTQNPNQKTSTSDYSNQSKKDIIPGQKGQANSNVSDQDKNTDRNSTTQQKDGGKESSGTSTGGMRKDPQSSDPRREREEEDRPRAGNK